MDTGGNVIEGLLIELGGGAIGIGDVPIFYFVGVMEERVGARAAKIDDQVGGIPGFAGDGFGGERFGGVAVGLQSLGSGGRDIAEGEKSGAGGVQDVGGITAGDGFSDGAAASVA